MHTGTVYTKDAGQIVQQRETATIWCVGRKESIAKTMAVDVARR